MSSDGGVMAACMNMLQLAGSGHVSLLIQATHASAGNVSNDCAVVVRLFCCSCRLARTARRLQSTSSYGNTSDCHVLLACAAAVVSWLAQHGGSGQQATLLTVMCCLLFARSAAVVPWLSQHGGSGKQAAHLTDMHCLPVLLQLSPGSHSTEAAVNKQLNDKERVAAALENAALLDMVNRCLAGSTVSG
jgi:hypothetical protein